MRQLFKSIFPILAIVFATVTAMATTAPRSHSVTGTIIDSRSGHPIEFATIAIYSEPGHSLVSGGITDTEGHFALKINEGTYKLEIAFMGYAPLEQEFTIAHGDVDLGKIKLKVDVKQIETIDVVADRAAVDYKIDKRVVNVGQQLNALSGTAIDVLENVPSIKVDIDGNVSMRGSSSFTVLIDGRPTPLDATDALRQIPASSIENIEVITNPST